MTGTHCSWYSALWLISINWQTLPTSRHGPEAYIHGPAPTSYFNLSKTMSPKTIFPSSMMVGAHEQEMACSPIILVLMRCFYNLLLSMCCNNTHQFLCKIKFCSACRPSLLGTLVPAVCLLLFSYWAVSSGEERKEASRPWKSYIYIFRAHWIPIRKMIRYNCLNQEKTFTTFSGAQNPNYFLIQDHNTYETEKEDSSTNFSGIRFFSWVSVLSGHA